MKRKILIVLNLILIMFTLSSCEAILSILQESFTLPTITEKTSTTSSKSENYVTNNKEYSSRVELSDKEYKDYTYYDLSKTGYYEWYYLNSIGEQKILVIPVTISGYDTVCTRSTLNDLNKCFFGEAKDTAWESLSSFYYKSSYEALEISGTVLPWTKTYKKSSLSVNFDLVINDTDAYLKENNIDPKDYDSDNDGYIDCIYYIYSCPTYDEYSNNRNIPDYFWAYTTSAELLPNKENPQVNNYCLASIDFMYNDSGLDARTYIHEFGHVLGLDDYYNASSSYKFETGDPVGDTVMMSYNIMDHDSFSKISLGWITPTFVNEETTNILLKPYEDYPMALVISDTSEFNIFSEYFVLELYTPTGLNYQDSHTPYLYNEDGSLSGPLVTGVRVYKVDSRVGYFDNKGKLNVLESLAKYNTSLGTLAYVAHSNTPEYSLYYDENPFNANYTEAKKPLIELIDKSGKSHLTYDYTQNMQSLFITGDSLDLSTITLNSGKKLQYIIEFGQLTDEGITINVVKKGTSHD